jgi:protein gp37
MGQDGYTDLPWTKKNAPKNVILHEDRLDAPLRWAKPRRIFVNSMSDLFHELVPFEFVDRVFAVAALAPRHTFQVLTKRPERMAEYFDPEGLPERELAILEATRAFVSKGAPYQGKGLTDHLSNRESILPLPNAWLGTSVEDNRVIDRVDYLRRVPAVIRFLSCEPLIGSLDRLDLEGVHWVIVGGESGPNHRPIETRWVRELCKQSAEAGAAFFFKQWGGAKPKTGGRELDGRTWDEMPDASQNRDEQQEVVSSVR